MASGENDAVSGWISFDRVEIDLAGRRLFVDAREIPIEPKAFAVLALLARQPGRAFTRDEILDAVWGHHHVTPGTLNRIVTLLRQALGEDAHNAQYLRTVHGVGYRFEAQTRFDERRAPVHGAAGVSEEIPAVDRPAVETDAPPAPNETPSPPASAPSPSGPPRASGHEAPPSRTDITALRDSPAQPAARRWLWPVAALSSCLLFAGAIGFWPSPRTPLPTQTPTKASPPMLVVLPLRSAAPDAALAEGLSEELITRLAHIEGLALIGQTSARLAQERKLDLEQLGQQLHVSHAIEGSLRQNGEQLRIDLRLLEVPSGKAIWAQNYGRKSSDIFAMQSEIAQAVAGALALRLGLAAAQTPASSEDAALYRQYLELRSVLLRPELTPGRPRHAAALAALREMVARAPDYARAHGLLAHYLSWWQVLDDQQRAEVEREAARALQLDPDLADAHEALAQQACKRLEWDPCIAEHRRALALDPTDVTIRTDYAFHLAAVGYLEEGLREFETAYRSDPIFPPASQYRAHVLDALGRHDEAKIAFDVVLKLTEPTNASYARWHNAVWRHDFAQAQQCAGQMSEKEGFRDSYLAVTAALQDASRWPQARKAIGESEHVTGRYNFSRLLDPAGYDAQAVLAAFENMLRSDHPPPYFLLAWQPEYAALRRTQAFQDYLRNTHILDYWRAHDFPPQCRPDGDGARCD